MVLLNNKPTELAMIAGKYVMSGSCTDVIGGTLTAGTPDNESSGLLTWAPPFNSAPMIFGTINSGSVATSSPAVRFTGVGVSNAYVTMSENGDSGVTIGIVLMGESRL